MTLAELIQKLIDSLKQSDNKLANTTEVLFAHITNSLLQEAMQKTWILLKANFNFGEEKDGLVTNLDKIYQILTSTQFQVIPNKDFLDQMFCQESKQIMWYPALQQMNGGAKCAERDELMKQTIELHKENKQKEMRITISSSWSDDGKEYDDEEYDLLFGKYSPYSEKSAIIPNQNLQTMIRTLVDRPSLFKRTYRGLTLMQEFITVLKSKDNGRLEEFLRNNPHIAWGSFYGRADTWLHVAYRFCSDNLLERINFHARQIDFVESLQKIISSHQNEWNTLLTAFQQLNNQFDESKAQEWIAAFKNFNSELVKAVRERAKERALAENPQNLNLLTLACGIQKSLSNGAEYHDAPAANFQTLAYAIWTLGEQAADAILKIDKYSKNALIRVCHYRNLDSIKLLLQCLGHRADAALTNGITVESPLSLCIDAGFDYASVALKAFQNPDARMNALFMKPLATKEQNKGEFVERDEQGQERWVVRGYHPILCPIFNNDFETFKLMLQLVGDKAQELLLKLKFHNQIEEEIHPPLFIACANEDKNQYGNLQMIQLILFILGDKAKFALTELNSDGDNILEYCTRMGTNPEIIKFLIEQLGPVAVDLIKPREKNYSAVLKTLFSYRLSSDEKPEKVGQLLQLILTVLGDKARETVLQPTDALKQSRYLGTALCVSFGEDKKLHLENKDAQEGVKEMEAKAPYHNYLMNILEKWSHYGKADLEDELRAIQATLLFKAAGDQSEKLIMTPDEYGVNALAYALCDKIRKPLNSKSTGYEQSGYRTLKVILEHLSESTKKIVVENIEYYLGFLLTPLEMSSYMVMPPSEKFVRSDRILQALIESLPIDKNKLTAVYQARKQALLCELNEQKQSPLMQLQFSKGDVQEYEIYKFYDFNFDAFDRLDETRAKESKAILDAADKRDELIFSRDPQGRNALMFACQFSSVKTIKVMLDALSSNGITVVKSKLNDYLQFIAFSMDLKSLAYIPYRMILCQKTLTLFASHFNMSILDLNKAFEAVLHKHALTLDSSGSTWLAQVMIGELNQQWYQSGISKELQETEPKRLAAVKMLLQIAGPAAANMVTQLNKNQQNAISLCCYEKNSRAWHSLELFKLLLTAVNENGKAFLKNNFQVLANLLAKNFSELAQEKFKVLQEFLEIQPKRLPDQRIKAGSKRQVETDQKAEDADKRQKVTSTLFSKPQPSASLPQQPQNNAGDRPQGPPV